MPESPLSRAGDARRRRDLAGEVDALLVGHRALTSAWWYPSQPADRLTVTLEASGTGPGWTEEYEVTEDGELRFLGSATAPEGAAGWFAGPSATGGDVLETPWMEAGPDRLTVTRQGCVVHQGRAAVPASEPSGAAGWPNGGFVFSACQFLALDDAGEQLRESAVALSVHGRVLYLEEPGAQSGERFELRLDVDDGPVLPATSGHGHDVFLWARTPGFEGRAEVWLHRMHFAAPTYGQSDGRVWAGLSATGPGRSLHRVREADVPVPAVGSLLPDWIPGSPR
ncbi:hypothetical protein ACWCOW_40730 [Streptomyces sp. NPDC001939]